MAPRAAPAAIRELRGSGMRLHHGPWTVYVGGSLAAPRRAIVSLGRTAGPAVVRSRVRRVARGVFGSSRSPEVNGSILLTARASVAATPRSQIRADLLRLKDRVARLLAHPPGRP